MGQMDKPKTLFAIYLIEDDQGVVTVKSDHYGPGFNSYGLGMSLLQDLRDMEIINPDVIQVQSLEYSPRTQ